jgi:hypothetical protein
MNLEAFRESLVEVAPPEGLSQAVQALWWDARGDWERAHGCAQAQDDAAGAAVHAYLHRKEGDLSNARYWYERSGRPMPDGPLGTEWLELAEEMLGA